MGCLLPRRFYFCGFRTFPDAFQQVVKHGVMLFLFRPDEGIKIIPVEKRFGALRKVFFGVAQAVVADGFSGVEQDFFVNLRFLGRIKSRLDFGMVETKELVVVGVGEFVQNHGRVLEHLVSRKEVFRPRNMHFAGESLVVSVVAQPRLAGVVLHRRERWMRPFNPDANCLQFPEPVLRDKNLDALKVIGQHGEGTLAFALEFSGEEGGVDRDRPAFDDLGNRVEAGGFGGRGGGLLRVLGGGGSV